MVMAGSLDLSLQGVNSEQIKNNIILVSVKLGELWTPSYYKDFLWFQTKKVHIIINVLEILTMSLRCNNSPWKIFVLNKRAFLNCGHF